MNRLANKVKVQAIGKTLIRSAWPQLLTVTAFMAEISIRFPLWFVLLSAVAIVAALIHVCQCLAAQSQIPRPNQDPVLGVILICSGLASIGLTMKWGTVENQLKLAPGALLYLTGHAKTAVSSTLAWSSVLTQWGSCSVFLVIVVIWALNGWRAVSGE